jgi:hypothetical protein
MEGRRPSHLLDAVERAISENTGNEKAKRYNAPVGAVLRRIGTLGPPGQRARRLRTSRHSPHPANARSNAATSPA